MSKFVAGPAPSFITGENGGIGTSGTVSAGNNWYEKGGLPPIGSRVQVGNRHHKPYTVIGYTSSGSVACEADGEMELKRFHSKDLRPLQSKIVDMSLFAGTDFLLRSKITGFSNLTSDLSVCHLHKYTPYIDHSNAVKGLTKKPKYLEPFKYTVLESHVTYHNDVKCETRNQNHRLDWPNIFHITITGLKDGWEYEE